MVKVLIVGQIATSEHWHLVHARVEKLQKSTHGPFDALLVLSHRDHLHEEDLTFPLPLFCFQDSTLSHMEIEEMQIVMIPKNAVRCIYPFNAYPLNLTFSFLGTKARCTKSRSCPLACISKWVGFKK